MARSSIDRRLRSPSVDELRHDLREADEQRFYLESALNGAATDWLQAYSAPPPIRSTHPITTHRVVKVAAVCAVAGLFLAAGLAWPQLRSWDRGHAAATVTPPPPTAEVVPAPVSVSEAAVSVRSSSPALSSTPRLHSAKVKRQNQNARRPVVRRMTPRPLSPAEFGRRVAPAS